MALLVNAITLPFIVILSLPLFFTAIFTTSLALSTLFIRASVVYVELFLALLQSALHPIIPRPSRKRPSPPAFASPVAQRTPHRTSLPPQTPSHQLPVRDYESVGGWVASEVHETQRWEAMTARLELPAMSPSLGHASVRRGKSGSLTTPARGRREGWASPEGYFAPVFTAGGGPSGVLEEGRSLEGSRVASRRRSGDAGRVGGFG